MSIDDLDLKLTLFHDDVGLCPNGQCSTSLRTDAVFDLGKKIPFCLISFSVTGKLL